MPVTVGVPVALALDLQTVLIDMHSEEASAADALDFRGQCKRGRNKSLLSQEECYCEWIPRSIVVEQGSRIAREQDVLARLAEENVVTSELVDDEEYTPGLRVRKHQRKVSVQQ